MRLKMQPQTQTALTLNYFKGQAKLMVSGPLLWRVFAQMNMLCTEARTYIGLSNWSQSGLLHCGSFALDSVRKQSMTFSPWRWYGNISCCYSPLMSIALDSNSQTFILLCKGPMHSCWDPPSWSAMEVQTMAHARIHNKEACNSLLSRCNGVFACNLQESTVCRPYAIQSLWSFQNCWKGGSCVWRMNEWKQGLGNAGKRLTGICPFDMHLMPNLPLLGTDSSRCNTTWYHLGDDWWSCGTPTSHQSCQYLEQYSHKIIP